MRKGSSGIRDMAGRVGGLVGEEGGGGEEGFQKKNARVGRLV